MEEPRNSLSSNWNRKNAFPRNFFGSCGDFCIMIGNHLQALTMYYIYIFWGPLQCSWGKNTLFLYKIGKIATYSNVFCNKTDAKRLKNSLLFTSKWHYKNKCAREYVMVRSQHLNNLTIFINPINIHSLRVNVYGKWAEKGEIFVYFVPNFNIKTMWK